MKLVWSGCSFSCKGRENGCQVVLMLLHKLQRGTCDRMQDADCKWCAAPAQLGPATWQQSPSFVRMQMLFFIWPSLLVWLWPLVGALAQASD
jgi:hypothetical protein